MATADKKLEELIHLEDLSLGTFEETKDLTTKSTTPQAPQEKETQIQNGPLGRKR